MAQCTAKSTQSGEQCKRYASAGSDKCHMHGGKSLKGIASPSLKHGRRSKYMPKYLLERYQEALHDPELLSLKSDLALTETRINELLARLDAGDSVARWQAVKETLERLDAAARVPDAKALIIHLNDMNQLVKAGVGDAGLWEELFATQEHKRKLLATQSRVLLDTQQVMTSEQVMLLATAWLDSIRRHINDRDTLALIQQDFIRTTEGDAGGRAHTAHADRTH
jgi:hypothetical protein